MLEEKIRMARKKLDESIITGKDYKEIYNLSVELDELIARYYIDRDGDDNNVWHVQYFMELPWKIIKKYWLFCKKELSLRYIALVFIFLE